MGERWRFTAAVRNRAATLARVFNAALALLYPEVCQACRAGRAGPSEGYICRACRVTARVLEPPWCERCGRPFAGAIDGPFECGDCQAQELSFSWARSAVAAKGVVLEMIHRYKYQRALWVEPFLAGLFLGQALPRLNPVEWDFLVPVPLHPVREREREFNQAERLAARLGRAAGIQVSTRLVRRVALTRTQTQLTREERRANVRNAFRAREDARIEAKRLLVIDDVFTTGATTNACARALRRAGAAEVCVWTLARGI